MGANFKSDNAAGVSPPILAALAAAGAGDGVAYGEDAWTKRLEGRMAALFEREVAVFPVTTGTAANALALAAIAPPYGAIYVHAHSHANTDECGAPEFYTGGAKLVAVAGAHGKLDPTELKRHLAVAPRGVHWNPRAAVSISQASEAGTIWRADDVAAIAEIARAHGLRLHMDGARFANAVAATGASPAALTWRAGVDVLSFGATKNGAFAAEAVVMFDPALAEAIGYRRKRGGHLLSKSRLIAAQLEAYLADDLWLRQARHANAQAARLAKGLAARPGAARVHPVEANMLFLALPDRAVSGLTEDGFLFYRWPDEAGRSVIRLVTSFETEPAMVDGFLASLDRHL
jgi:threonine aldolase